MKAACNCARPEGIGTTSATLAAAFLPKFGCPFCWPFYAAVFGALGIPLQFINWVLTLLTAAMAVSMFQIFVRSREERSASLLAVVSSLSVLAFRLFDLPRATCIAGSIGLVLALTWRALTRTARQRTLRTP